MKQSIIFPFLLQVLLLNLVLLIPKVHSIKCFSCTNEMEGCDEKLTASSEPSMIKECPPLAKGCLTIAIVYKFPTPTYVFRDCLYEPYRNCVDNSESHVSKTKLNVNAMDTIKCLNTARVETLNLLPLSLDDVPDEYGNLISTVYLTDQTGFQDLNNGYEPVDSRSSRQIDISCYECFFNANSSQTTTACRGPLKDLQNLHKQCKKGAWGCAMLYEGDYNGGKLKWIRRECWYEGDLACLKRSYKKGSSARHFTIIQPGECNGRNLIAQDKEVSWDGAREFQSASEFQEFLKCRKKVRSKHQVSEDVLSKINDFLTSTVVNYYYCSPRDKCNALKIRSRQLSLTTSTTTTTTSRTTTTTRTTTTRTSTTRTRPTTATTKLTTSPSTPGSTTSSVTLDSSLSTTEAEGETPEPPGPVDPDDENCRCDDCERSKGRPRVLSQNPFWLVLSIIFCILKTLLHLKNSIL